MTLRGTSLIAAAALWLLTGAVARHEASAHEQNEHLLQRLIGTWTFVAQPAASDGKAWPADAPATGILVFTSDGQFAQIQVVPAGSGVGSASRVKSAAKASVALFGTYTVDDATRMLTYRIHSSTIPHWDGNDQRWSIGSVTAEELRLRDPVGPMQSLSPATTWKRADTGAVVVAPRADVAR
jgi:hypothetical protein